MPNIWHGADPTGQIDANDYEMGTVVVALRAVTLDAIRVHSPANAVNRTNRRGHVWSMTGTLLATVVMPDAMPSGWSTHPLPSPMPLDPGDMVVISYETSGNYSAISAALGTDAHVALDNAMAMPQSQAVLVAGSSTTGNGRFNPTPGLVPNTSFNHTWYGVDAEYTVAGAGTAPSLTGLALSADGLTVTATLTASDPEGLTGATYAVDWGDGTVTSTSSPVHTHTYATSGIKAVLASVTDSTGLDDHRSGAIEIYEGSDGLDITGILTALESHAAATGRFERVNRHEPKSSPGTGVTASIWAQQIRPYPPGSGLAATTGVVVFTMRLYTSMTAEPADMIDPEILAAVDVLMGAYSDDFTLGGRVRNVDLLGAAGTPLGAQAGYINIDRTLYRVMDLTIPVIVNDLWTQAP